jgi:hypothetical protein
MAGVCGAAVVVCVYLSDHGVCASASEGDVEAARLGNAMALSKVRSWCFWGAGRVLFCAFLNLQLAGWYLMMNYCFVWCQNLHFWSIIYDVPEY